MKHYDIAYNTEREEVLLGRRLENKNYIYKWNICKDDGRIDHYCSDNYYESWHQAPNFECPRCGEKLEAFWQNVLLMS